VLFNRSDDRLENQRLIYGTLRDSLESLQRWFDSSDQRAGILLAAAGVLLGFLVNGLSGRPGPLSLMWLALALLVLVISVVCGAIVVSSRPFYVPVVHMSAARALGHPHFAALVEATINLANAVSNNERRYRGKRAWYWWQLYAFVFGVVFVAAALITGYVS